MSWTLSFWMMGTVRWAYQCTIVVRYRIRWLVLGL